MERVLEIESDPQAADVDAMFDALVAEYADVDPIRAGIDRVVGIRAAMSALQAEELRELAALQRMAEVAAERRAREAGSASEFTRGKHLEIAHRTLVAELAVACRVSDRTMAARLADAEIMVTGFPGRCRPWPTGRSRSGTRA
jgi:hypothetical protein